MRPRASHALQGLEDLFVFILVAPLILVGGIVGIIVLLWSGARRHRRAQVGQAGPAPGEDALTQPANAGPPSAPPYFDVLGWKIQGWVVVSIVVGVASVLFGAWPLGIVFGVAVLIQGRASHPILLGPEDPLTLPAAPSETPETPETPASLGGEPLEWTGEPVHPGIVTDTAQLVAPGHRPRVRGILVFEDAHPDAERAYDKATALVFARGARYERACMKAQDKQIPAVTQVGDGIIQRLKAAKSPLTLKVDGGSGRVEVVS